MGNGPRNTILDLGDHLFMALERLSDEGLTEEELLNEIKRAKAVSDVAGKVIEAANVTLEAERFKDNRMDANATLPRLLGA